MTVVRGADVLTSFEADSFEKQLVDIQNFTLFLSETTALATTSTICVEADSRKLAGSVATGR